VGVKLDNEAVIDADYLVWCMVFCVNCPAFASQYKQKKPSSAPPMCYTLEIIRCIMLHAADIGIQRLAHTKQNPVKQDRIIHLHSNIYSTMAPYVANRSANRKKKSRSYVDPATQTECPG